MKKKLEIQTIVVLLCVLGIAGAWIGIQVARDSLGVWSESAELHFATQDLLGLGPRSEVRCAGGMIGHVRKVTPSVGPDGTAHFALVAGVRREFASWRFTPLGIVKLGVVQSALAPSSIHLDLATTADAVRARHPKEGPPPVLRLEKEKSKNDLADVADQYRKLGDQIDRTIRQFTDPQAGRTESVMQELARAIPAAASSMRQLDDVASSLSGRSVSADPEKRPPMERLLLNLDASTSNLKGTTASLQTNVGEGGKLDRTLDTLNASLLRLQGLTDEMTKTVANVNLKIDGSLKKMNGLLDETTGTMSSLHGKVEGFGDTFLGRMLIKPEKKIGTPDITPIPVKPARKSR